MIPLFKTDASMGKSMLVLKPKDDRSIFNLPHEDDKIIIVEDEMSSIFEACKIAKEKDKQIVFGLRAKFANGLSKEEIDDSVHKNIIFAKNKDGIYELMNFYSEYKSNGGVATYGTLKKHFSKNLEVCVPFYDSYIHKNFFFNGSAVPELDNFEPKFFYEKNILPFDSALERLVRRVDINPVLTKSIYYKDRADFKAWQTFKIACSRNMGKTYDINNPNLEHCGSDEFCWESYAESRKNN